MLGGFGAFGNPSSFHDPTVRQHRGRSDKATDGVRLQASCRPRLRRRRRCEGGGAVRSCLRAVRQVPVPLRRVVAQGRVQPSATHLAGREGRSDPRRVVQPERHGAESGGAGRDARRRHQHAGILAVLQGGDEGAGLAAVGPGGAHVRRHDRLQLAWRDPRASRVRRSLPADSRAPRSREAASPLCPPSAGSTTDTASLRARLL